MLSSILNDDTGKGTGTGRGDGSKHVRVFVAWKNGRHEIRKGLGNGRHLIGDSEFAAIKIADGSQSISGYLEVTDESIKLKCTRAKPALFIDGKKLKPGEIVVVGDLLEASVGRQPVVISAMPSLANEASEEASEAKPHTFQSEVETALGSIDELRQVLSRQLLDQMNLTSLDLSKLESPEIKETARLKLRRMITELVLPLDFPWRREVIERQVYNEVMGLGPLEDLLADPTITEIMVNGKNQIFIERSGKLVLSGVNFSSDQALLHVIERIVSTVGRRIDKSSPVVDARLLDGSRVNAVIPPLALKGPALTIRRFSKKPITVDQLINWQSLTQPMADFLRVCVLEHKNIIISGGTGSGKTTLLNALSTFIPDSERIITVEDAAELQLQQQHVVSLETRPPNLEGKGAVTIRDLVKNTLRMRPDRIVVGECRSGEALDMLQAMNTGHDGSMTTAHANSPEDMLRRLETMVMMAGMDLPLRAIREQITSAVTIVVQQTRFKTGKRLVTNIAWVRSLERDSGQYEILPLFERYRDEHVDAYGAHLEKFWKEEEMATGINQLSLS